MTQDQWLEAARAWLHQHFARLVPDWVAAQTAADTAPRLLAEYGTGVAPGEAWKRYSAPAGT